MKSRGAISVLAITAFTAGALVGCSITGNGDREDRSDVRGDALISSHVAELVVGVDGSGR